MRDSPWFILGAGAIGSLFAAALRESGIPVRLLLRDEQRLALWRQQGGLLLRDGPSGVLRNIDVDVAVVTSPGGPIKHLLVCTKAHQTEAAITELLSALAPQPLLVLLQNGLGVKERIQTLLPAARFLHAITTEGAYRTQPCEVVHAGHGETLVGALEPEAHPLARIVTDELRNDFLPLRAVTDIGTRLWLKLAVNSVINPLTALHGCRNGELMQLPDFRDIASTLCAEVAAVANAAGQPLNAADCKDAVIAVIEKTAANRSSMLQDIRAGRTTEIEFINGHIVSLAHYLGIRCPQQESLLQKVRECEAAIRRFP